MIYTSIEIKDNQTIAKQTKGVIKMTNREFYSKYYKPYQKTHMTEKTCYTRCNIIENRLLAAHGEETPKEISYLIIEGIYDQMKSEGLKQNTIFGAYAALYSFFKMAVEHGESEENPVKIARTVTADLKAGA